MWYDVICLVIIALSVWRGMVKGIIWQLATIAGLVICFFFSETVSTAVAPHIGIQPPLSRWVAIFGLYVVSSFAAFALAALVQGTLEKLKFDDYDRHLGAIFGAIKGATICLIISFFLFTLTDASRETVMHSKAGYVSAVALHTIQPVLPGELDDILSPYLAGFDPESIKRHRLEHPEGEYNYGHHDHNHDGTSSYQDSDIREMVSKIPGLFSSELQQIVYQTIEKTDPKDRPELLEKLGSGSLGIIRQVVSEWAQGKPKEEPSSPTSGEDWRQHRARLLREIAGIYTEHLDAQETIMEEVVYALQGVPDAITVSVLDDWHADLMNRKPDPDPQTTLTTALDRRVLNQVQKARISIGTLPIEIQQRLSDIIKG